MSADAVSLLKRLIAVPSYSGKEDGTAELLCDFLRSRGVSPRRAGNNVWAVNRHFDASKPTLLLNSHHDTVRPVSSWTMEPHVAVERDGKIYGLGSNDAGASAVCLVDVFCRFYESEMRFNTVLAVTAEEENGGVNGMRAFLPALASEGISVDMALVGEPTGMQPAVAERGLVVLDCEAHGVSGHAARGEGVNAIYKAMSDIARLRDMTFARESAVLGPITINVTQIAAGTQHNVVPDSCRFVADVRTTDAYSNEETVRLIRAAIESDVVARSTRVQASVLDVNHPMVRAAVRCGGVPFVSPTTSDMSLMHGIPSLKMGPGDSSRSHKADEYIRVDEIAGGVAGYAEFLTVLDEII